jgi:hypothetical protein
MKRINITLPSHVVRPLFFALRRVRGMRHAPIHHHGQRRSVFERLGPHVRRSAANGRGFGRIFTSAVRNLRPDARRGRRQSPVRRGRQASPLAPHLQSQPPSPRRGVNGAGPSNVGARAVQAPAPPIVEAPAPPVDEIVAVPMEPMSPALPPPPPRFWCDSCKEYTQIPHTLDPWLLATQAAPALYAVEEEEKEDVVPGLDIREPFNTAASTGIFPYSFLDRAGPSAHPPAMTLPLPQPVKPEDAEMVAVPGIGPLAPPPGTRATAAARMEVQAPPRGRHRDTPAPPWPQRGSGGPTPRHPQGILEPGGPQPSNHGGAEHGSLQQRLLPSR